MQLAELQSFISSLLSQGVKLTPNGDRLKLDGDKEVLTEEALRILRENKQDILKLLKEQTAKSKAKVKKVIRQDGKPASQEEIKQERFLETAVGELGSTEFNNLISRQYVHSVIESSTTIGAMKAIELTPTFEESPQAYLRGRDKNLSSSCQHEFYELSAEGTVRMCMRCRLIERRVESYADSRF